MDALMVVINNNSLPVIEYYSVSYNYRLHVRA